MGNPFTTLETLIRSLVQAMGGLTAAVKNAAPVTSSQPANQFLASPSTGAGTPGFRDIVTSDIQTAGDSRYARSAQLTDGSVAIYATAAAGDTPFSLRNRIINGDMRIDQRNSGAAMTSINQYTVDRWGVFSGGSPPTTGMTIQQNLGGVSGPSGFPSCLGAQVTSSYTPTSGQSVHFDQSIEGESVGDFAWATAGAEDATLSFWAYSSLTGTFGGSVVSGDGTNGFWSFPFPFDIPTANTWTHVVIPVPGNTRGTFKTDNSVGIYVRFGLGSGSSWTAPSGSWQSGNYVQPTGTVNLVKTNGATFYFTGVQFEKGTVATPFETRPIGFELSLCQRYYQQVNVSARFPTSASGQTSDASIGWSSMRATPTAGAMTGNSNNLVSSTSMIINSSFGGRFEVVSSGAGDCYSLNGNIPLDAEL